MKGIAPPYTYSVKSHQDEFTGLQLVGTIDAAFQTFAPSQDVGIVSIKEHEIAVGQAGQR